MGKFSRTSALLASNRWAAPLLLGGSRSLLLLPQQGSGFLPSRAGSRSRCPSRAPRNEHFASAPFFQDIFNSVVAALFLLIVGLFAVIIKTNHGTLAGGVSRNVLMSSGS